MEGGFISSGGGGVSIYLSIYLYRLSRFASADPVKLEAECGLSGDDDDF